VFNASKKYNAQLKEIGNDYTGFCGTLKMKSYLACAEITTRSGEAKSVAQSELPL